MTGDAASGAGMIAERQIERDAVERVYLQCSPPP